MPRQTYAAEQLAEEVTAFRESAKVEIADDPDGLDVYRAIKFDEKSTESLRPVLDVIAENDERIQSVEQRNKQVIVTFVPDFRADSREPFDVAGVAEVLSAK